MAEEQGAFAFGDVVEAITRKMIRRHPHVFADKDGGSTPADVKGAWDRIKAEEKAERAARRPPGTSRPRCCPASRPGQPALTRAMELQRKASSVGFDWNDPRAVLHKIREEADEIEAALDRGDAENSPTKPATCCSRWSTWRAMSAPIPMRRCAAPTPSSSGALPISSERWPRRGVRWKALHWRRWMRCGTRRKRKERSATGCAAAGSLTRGI